MLSILFELHLNNNIIEDILLRDILDETIRYIYILFCLRSHFVHGVIQIKSIPYSKHVTTQALTHVFKTVKLLLNFTKTCSSHTSSVILPGYDPESV